MDWRMYIAGDGRRFASEAEGILYQQRSQAAEKLAFPCRLSLGTSDVERAIKVENKEIGVCRTPAELMLRYPPVIRNENTWKIFSDCFSSRRRERRNDEAYSRAILTTARDNWLPQEPQL